MYTVAHYFLEALFTAIIETYYKIKELFKPRKPMVTPVPEKPPEIYWGWVNTFDERGEPIQAFSPKHLGFEITLPRRLINIRGMVSARRKPAKVRFTFIEASSPKWFEDIKKLAEEVEKRMKKGGK